MSGIVEKTGKSVEEAVSLALEELRCTREEAEIEILTAPAKGLWGILGTKEARVRVRKKEEKPENAAEAGAGGAPDGKEDKAAESGPADGRPEGNGRAEENAAENDTEADGAPDGETDKTAAFLVKTAALMGVPATIEKQENDEVIFYALAGTKMGALIGKRGETLDALQYLSNIVAGKDKGFPRKRVIVDAEDYRKRREETLVHLAERLAAKAKKTGRRVVLEPMNPQERRVIHTALEKDPEVKSLSEGEEPYRRLVIYPAGSARGREGSRESGSLYERDGWGEGK